MNAEKIVSRSELVQEVHSMLQRAPYRHVSIVHALLKRWSGDNHLQESCLSA